MEEGENQGAAMNIKGIKEREGDLLSNDAQEQKIGLRGVGCENQEPRASYLPSHNFSSSFNTSYYFEGGWIFDCGACHMSRMIF